MPLRPESVGDGGAEGSGGEGSHGGGGEGTMVTCPSECETYALSASYWRGSANNHEPAVLSWCGARRPTANTARRDRAQLRALTYGTCPHADRLD